MAIDVFELYEELCGTVNTQQGGHVRPERNFLQWVNAVSLSLFEEKFAAWEKSQKIVDDMSQPFLQSINLQVKPESSTHGIAAFPEDYGHFSSARYYRTAGGVNVPLASLDLYDCCGKKMEESDGCPPFLDKELWEAMQSEKKAKTPPANKPALTEVSIDLISNSRWSACLGSRFNGPTMNDPKMTQYDKGYKVAPAGVTMIVLDYLRLPTPATFVYTMVPADTLTGRGDYLVYDKSNSKPLEWSTLIRNEILVRLEKKYGKYIREDFIWQTSESDRKTTV